MVSKVTKHIAIVLDGNRRYAKKLGFEPWKGQEFGLKKLEQLIKWCQELNIKELTLYSFSTLDKDFAKSFPKKAKEGGKIGMSEKLGQFFAARLKEKGIQKIAFDRGGYQYHGRIKALAQSLRQAGIEF